MKRTCAKCLVTDQVSGASLDRNGVCRFCREWGKEDREVLERGRVERERDLEHTLANATGEGKYDCIVAFSGGKDSCYLLYRIVEEYGLRTLAYTSDFDIPDRTWDNIVRTVRRLRVDHYVHRPSLDMYRRFVRHLLQNQGANGAVDTVCYFWLDLRESEMLRLATDEDIPLVITGYSPGQPKAQRMVYELPREAIHHSSWVPEGLRKRGVLTDDEVRLFWDSSEFEEGTRFPRLIAPFHAWRYDQEDVMRKVVELGLARDRLHANPVLSNFTLNWLFIYSDLLNLGYNPYKPEFAQLVREGRASRRTWLVLFSLMDWMIRRRVLLGRHVDRSLEWLDLREQDLRIAAHPGSAPAALAGRSS